MQPKFFSSAEKFRAWLLKHHAAETELWLGYYKKASGLPSVTYKEAVDEALCFGWIDGVRMSIDEKSFRQRFTPRKKTSIWSNVNVGRVEELAKLGKMHASGLAAFAARDEKKTGVYSAENRERSVLDSKSEKRFKANKRAWEFFQAQAESYKRTAIWLVISAKKEETRTKRLETLIHDSQQRRTIKQLTRKKKR